MLTTILILMIGFQICSAPTDNSLLIFRDEPIKKYYSSQDHLQAIIFIESGNKGAGAYNRNEPLAVGLLCEWPVIVTDCNRILGYEKYSLNDRLIPRKAIEMFWIYQNHYNPTLDFEKMCRIWCAGPNGKEQDCSLPYFELAQKQLYTL